MSAAKTKAEQLCQQGLVHYNNWDIERAIEAFRAAIILNKTNPDHFLYLAQCYVRVSNYKGMRKALGQFIHLERDSALVDRFEGLFGNALDPVESLVTETMVEHNASLEIVGAAMQLWLDFKVAVGRDPIQMQAPKLQSWAAALDYTVRKINFYEVEAEILAPWYMVSDQAVLGAYKKLMQALDIMPCDYRYFRGRENPLDKLVEAAMMLDELEQRFYKV